MLRIPATPLLLPVIEQLISDRINVNAVLVFSPAAYKQVFDGYLSGLERLIQQGELLDDVVCFVSVSMGCLDAAMNPFTDDSEISFAIMQARLLYQRYQHLDRGKHYRLLPEEAKSLRLVWDCTDISPDSAWHYLQALVAPETVIMLSPSSLETYRGISLLPNHWPDDEDERLVSRLRQYPLDEQFKQLVNQEMMRSLNAFERLLATIEAKRMR